jgi:hypothetical protein
MFTVEIEFDHSKIVTLDESDECDDVEVYIMEDNTVFIQQQHEGCDPESIMMSYNQLLDIVSALNLSSGAYFLRPRKRVIT